MLVSNLSLEQTDELLKRLYNASLELGYRTNFIPYETMKRISPLMEAFKTDDGSICCLYKKPDLFCYPTGFPVSLPFGIATSYGLFDFYAPVGNINAIPRSDSRTFLEWLHSTYEVEVISSPQWPSQWLIFRLLEEKGV